MARDLVVLRVCLGIGRWVAPVLLVEGEEEVKVKEKST